MFAPMQHFGPQILLFAGCLDYGKPLPGPRKQGYTNCHKLGRQQRLVSVHMPMILSQCVLTETNSYKDKYTGYADGDFFGHKPRCLGLRPRLTSAELSLPFEAAVDVPSLQDPTPHPVIRTRLHVTGQYTKATGSD